MMVLFLDDDDSRITKARQDFIGHSFVAVKTAQEAIEELSRRQFDLVCLDHDLGDQVMVDSGPGTGYEVAQFIAQMPIDERPQAIMVHSFNPVGAQNMIVALAENGIDSFQCPFGGDLWQRLVIYA